MFASGSISEIALIFLTREDFSRQAERALAVIGRELAVSRCSIFMDPDDGVISVSRGLWRADGIDGDIPDRWYSACADIFMNEDLCGSAGVCAISDVKSIPSGSGRELESMGVRSLLAAPIIVDGVIHGFLGAEECSEPREWKETEMETLKTAAVIITAAYSRLLLSGRLSVSEENFRGFFNTISDIILIADTEGRLIYANAGACAKLGFSLSELGGWPLIELCPFEKKDGMRLAMNEAMLHRKVGNYQSELNVRSGGRIPVDTLIWAGRWDNRECLFSLSRDLSAEHSALQKFERLFRGNPAAMALLVSTDRVFSDVNESFVEKFGYSRDEVIGRSGYSLGIFIYDDRFLRMEDELTRSGRIRNRELTFRHRDGRNIHALFYGETFKNGGEEYLLAVMVDVTDQVHLQMALESEQRRLANIIEGGGLGTWEWDIQSGRIVFNERWAASMGYKLDELRPIDMDKCASLIHPDDFAESMKRINRHLEGKSDFYEHEVRMRHRDGSWIWTMNRGSIIERDSGGRPLRMYGTHSDITEKKVMEEQIRDLVARDPLTELYNRRYIFDRLEEIVSEYVRLGRNFCVSILDVDHFKAINDLFGHQAGDMVLKEFAGIAASMIRQYEFIGRYGGEEFIIISPASVKVGVRIMIERIMSRIRSSVFTFDGNEISVTFSCGIVESSELTLNLFSVENVLSLADMRLYKAKERGRDCCVDA